jgi:formylglycine-generating enzyme required for sulfatase activity
MISRGLRLALAICVACTWPFFMAAGESHAELKTRPGPAPNAAALELSTGRNFRIAPLDLELVWIAPGRFTMGSPADEPARNKAEGPQHEVTLTKGFWLGKTEVTQRQYAAVAEANPSRFQAVGDNAPVEEVSWLDAMEFCRQLTEREHAADRLPDGYTFTLPTEAQWEYACRAGTAGAYAGNPEAMAWHKGNSGDSTHPVGTKQPNAWGLHDMYGNVLEWCLDWYGNYKRGAQTDPTGPDSGYFRISRGGSWRVDVFRSASRAGGSPGRRDYTIGFRLALTAK